MTSTRCPGANGLTVPVTGTVLRIRALPPCRWPTLIFTVELAGPRGAGASRRRRQAWPGRTKVAAKTRADEKGRFTGGMLLAEQGDRIVQHVQQDPRDD